MRDESPAPQTKAQFKHRREMMAAKKQRRAAAKTKTKGRSKAVMGVTSSSSLV